MTELQRPRSNMSPRPLDSSSGSLHTSITVFYGHKK